MNMASSLNNLSAACRERASVLDRRQFAAGLLAAGVVGSLGCPAWAAGQITIGRSLALSGPLKAYGQAKLDGGDAYIDKVNKAGGVGGKLIELVTLDDEYQAAKIVANLNELAKKHAPTAFLGLFGVPTITAALPVLMQVQIPAVGLTSGTATLRTPHNPYSFPVRASYADEARKLAQQVKVLGASKISIVFSDNPFGESQRDILKEALAKEGLDGRVFKIDAAGVNAAATVKLALADAPQAVFLTVLSGVAVPVLREIKKTNGAQPMLYTFSTVDTSIVLRDLGAGAAGLGITQIVPIPTGTRIAVVSEYLDALKALGRGTPSFYGLEAFIEAKVLVEGLRRAGNGANSPAALVKALETMTSYDAGGYFVSYGPGVRTGSRFVEIDIIDATGVVRR
jgi:branched-chain amino acid transport system substrate-binding protein